VRMYATILGKAGFRRGMDLYVARHDNQAVTIEDFVKAFEEASGRDLSQFALWYHQAGTPEITVEDRYDSATQSYELTVAQVTPPTPGQPEKEPVVIPLAMGLVGPGGEELPTRLEGEDEATRGTRVLAVGEARQSFRFVDVPAPPVPSLLRNFSAPVKLRSNLSDSDQLFLLAHDSDPFNRWQAMQALAMAILVAEATKRSSGKAAAREDDLIPALAQVLADTGLEPAFIAQVLTLPGEADVAQEIGNDIDPDAIFRARTGLRALIGLHLNDALTKTYRVMTTSGPYKPDAASAGRRALKNICLDLLAATAESHAIRLAAEQFKAADNMTDRMAALSTLSLHDAPQRAEALEDFYRRYSNDPLIIGKWFALQAAIPERGTLDRVRALSAHPAFSFANPNRVRALIGAFSANHLRFHNADGSGYQLVGEVIRTLDAVNPQVAARMAGAFESWRRYDQDRQVQMRAELAAIRDLPGISPNLFEVAGKMLA